MRSRNGNVNWQVGQLTLKERGDTGPFLSASSRMKLWPFVSFSEIAGAGSPAGSVLSRLPQKIPRTVFFRLIPKILAFLRLDEPSFPVSAKAFWGENAH